MNLWDKVVGYFSPQSAVERLYAREMMNAWDTVAKPQASYDGAVMTPHDRPWDSINGNPTVNNYGMGGGTAKDLRDRARHLCQNEAIACGMVDRLVENIVGNGYGLHPLTGSKAWNKLALKLWDAWKDSADYGGATWQERLELAVTHWQREGDYADILLDNGQLQAVDPIYINTPTYKLGDPSFHEGVQTDDSGKVIAYWLDVWDGYAKKAISKSVAPNNFVFIANRKATTGFRGESIFASSFRIFEQLSQIHDAVLKAQKIQAFFAVAITTQDATTFNKALPIKPAKKPTPVGQASPAPSTDLSNVPLHELAPRRRNAQLEAAMIQRLKPGEQISAVSPGQPGAGYTDSFKLTVQTIGLPAGMPQELVLMDFKGTTYSSGKMAMNNAQRSFRRKQRKFIDGYLTRIYRWRISKWIKEGKLPWRADAWNHRWIPSPFPYLDATKDMAATQMEVDVGVKTLAQVITEHGGNIDDYIEQRGDELERLKGAGIPIYHSNTLLDAMLGATTPPDHADEEEGGDQNQAESEDTPENEDGGNLDDE